MNPAVAIRYAGEIGRLQQLLLDASAALDDCEKVDAFVYSVHVDEQGCRLHIEAEGARALLLEAERTSRHRFHSTGDREEVHCYAVRDGVTYSWIVAAPEEVEQGAEVPA